MTDYDFPAWNPVIAGLRQRGIAAVLETSIPGWWWVSVVTEDPNEQVMIGSYPEDADDNARQEASIDLDVGPQHAYLVYRQITGDPTIHVTDDFHTQTTDLDELADVIRQAIVAPVREL